MQDAPPALMRQWAMRWSNADCAAAADGSAAVASTAMRNQGRMLISCSWAGLLCRAWACLKSLPEDGGGGGIRTHGTLARTTVFETVPIDHSGTPPGPSL